MKRNIIGFIIVCLSVFLYADKEKLPGDNTLVSSEVVLEKLISYDKKKYKYSVEDYFKTPEEINFRLSPDGKYLSFKKREVDGKVNVYIREISSNITTKVIEEKEQPIGCYMWLNNQQLLYLMDKNGNEIKHLYAVDINGSNERNLTPYKGVNVKVAKLLKKEKDFIIIQMNKNNPEVFEPYRLNTLTGDITLLYKNTNIKEPITSYIFDKDGELRAYVKLENGLEKKLYYKNTESKVFELIHKIQWTDIFSILAFNYNSDNKNDAYIISNLQNDKRIIYLYDLKDKKIIKEMFSNETYDVSGFRTSKKNNYEIQYFIYKGEKRHIIPVSDNYKKLHKKFKKEFKGLEFNIVDETDNEDKLLLYVYSDRVYGMYYLYDLKTDKIEKLLDVMPNLKELDMAKMEPITFKSRDGLTIHGYLTLPVNIKANQKIPMIVNPHGGPQGLRDSWGFNKEAQLFASRGYATLHVNFRISGGYGKKFLNAGFKQVGRKVMEDIEDGVSYVLKQGIIDENKIAIYGGSHGGYATLMGLAKTPDLYACGVDYVGVSNILTFMDTIHPTWKPYIRMMKNIWYDLDDKKEYEIAKTVSPVYIVDNITKPLFVVQGAHDPRVNINESDQIVRKLRDKNFDVPYMVKYNEGHGFEREENKLEFYQAMMGFFAKHLK